MENQNLFLNFNGQILDKRPEKHLEIAGLNDSDIMFIHAIAIEEGLNANNALFEQADLEKAVNTFIGKPLKILYVSHNPTGHGYNDKTGEFDDNVKNIGYIYDAYGSYFDKEGNWLSKEDGGTYKVIVYMAVWQKYHAEIAMRLRQLHAENDLKFSIECTRDYEITAEGYRKCFNLQFNGLAVVENPAFENARSLMVAEKEEKGGNVMDFEKLYNEEVAKNAELSEQLNTEKEAREKAEQELSTVKSELLEKAETLTTMEGDLKIITTERDSFKSTVEKAEKEKLGTARLAKLQKYGEVTKTTDELAEMTGEEFVETLEAMVDNFKPTEKAEIDNGIIVVPHEKGRKKDTSRKEKLLSLIDGLK